MIKNTTKVQSLRFCRDVFTERSAKKWAKDHGYKYGKVDPTKRQYRIRQQDPEDFQPTSFRTVKFRPGVWAVIGRPKKGGTMPKKKKATKKRAVKKRAVKKRAVKKKATKKRASKKRNPPKKKTAKKKSVKRRKSNSLGLDIKSNGKTLSSSKPCPLWTVWMKTPKGRIPVGQITAKTKAEAKKKAAAYMRKLFK